MIPTANGPGSPHGYQTYFEEIRGDIDKQIKKLEDAICALKEKRNRLSLMSRLPPELMSHIFLLARKDGTLSYLPTTSHVCRAWRATALGCAQLWTTIDCVRVRWAQEMMARTSGASITLLVSNWWYNHGKVPEARMLEAVRFALGAAERAKTLVLSDCPFPGLDGQQDLKWPTSAPLLDTLRLTAPDGDTEAYQLPDALVHGSFPKLTKVSLSHCTFSWNIAGFFGNLTELRLTHRSSSQLLVPDVSKTLHALQQMTLLESLHLSIESRGGHRVESEDGSFHVPPGLAKFKLPRLAVLELGVNDLLAVALLLHISHPRERLRVACGLPTVERARAIVECLRRYRLFKIENGYSMDAVFLDRPFSSWDIKVYDLSRPEECSPLWADIMVPFYFRTQICDVIGVGLPFADMTTVMVTSMNLYRDVSQYLSGCTTLCASEWSVGHNDDFFAHGSFTGEGGDRVLPALHTLILHELDLSALPKTSKKPDRLTIPKLLKELGDICQYFERLKLFDCKIYAQEKLDVLRGKVQHFEHYCSPSLKGYRGKNHASTMQKLLGDGRL